MRERMRSTGELPHAEVLDELRFAHVLVVSSRLESLPNVILEAFDAGAAVAACAVGGIPELVRDRVSGLLCDKEDSHCLAEAIHVLDKDVPLRRSLARTGRRVVRELLSRRAKGMALMRVYMGERLAEPLDIDAVAAEPEAGEVVHVR